jgi:hypothetical protein
MQCRLSLVDISIVTSNWRNDGPNRATRGFGGLKARRGRIPICNPRPHRSRRAGTAEKGPSRRKGAVVLLQ